MFKNAFDLIDPQRNELITNPSDQMTWEKQGAVWWYKDKRQHIFTRSSRDRLPLDTRTQ